MRINKSGRNVTSLFISLLLKDGDCVKQFNSDKEIKEYIEKSIDSIKVLDECRLYREEQLQITEEVMRARNSTEWLIRINKVINNFIYAISRSYAYAVKMNSPLEETENSQMYAYYLEDAVECALGLCCYGNMLWYLRYGLHCMICCEVTLQYRCNDYSKILQRMGVA